MKYLLGIILLLIGIWFISIAYFNWDFAMKKENVKWPLGNLPRFAARIIYGVLGFILFLLGALSIADIVYLLR
jgi:hypothetical protein